MIATIKNWASRLLHPVSLMLFLLECCSGFDPNERRRERR